MAIAASLVVRISAQYGNFVRGVEQAEKTLKRFGKQAQSADRDLSTSLTLPIVALGAVMYKAASDLERTENMFESSFGAMAGAARSWSEATATALGLDADEIRASMSRYNELATSMNLTAASALTMSEGLTQLTLDLMAYRNISEEAASGALEAAMAGRMKGLRQLGIVVKEADVRETALRLGIIRTGQTMTTEGTAVAAYITMREKLVKVNGEFARSVDRPAVMLVRLRQQMGDVAETMGKALMPGMQKVVGLALALTTRLRSLAAVFAQLPASVRIGAVAIAGLAAALGPALWGLGTMLLILPKIKRAMMLAFTPFGGMALLVIAALVSMGAAVLAVADNWTYLKRQVALAWAWIVDNVLGGVGALLRGFAVLATVRGFGGLAAAMNAAADGVASANERMLSNTSVTVTRLTAMLNAEILAAGGVGGTPGAGEGPRRLAEYRALIAGLRGAGGGGDEGAKEPNWYKALETAHEQKVRREKELLEQSQSQTYRWARYMDEQATAVEQRFAEMANNIADSLTNLFSDVLMGQADAFARFLATIERMIADFAARQAMNAIGKWIGEALLSSYSPLGGTPSPSASLMGARASGDTFHVNVSFAPAFIDGRSGAAWLRENEGVITEAVISGVRKSAAARAAIVGR